MIIFLFLLSRLRARAKALIYDGSPDDSDEVKEARENAKKKIIETQSVEEREREAKKREEEKPTHEPKEISENTVEYTIAGKGMKGIPFFNIFNLSFHFFPFIPFISNFQ